jgi:signal transduction histidine kinase
MSLRWRLSWLLALTAVLTVTAFGLFAYFAARDSALEAAHAKLRSTIVQINAITELGGINQLEALRTAASHPAVVEALSHANGGANGELAPAVEEALLPLRGSTPAAQTAAVVELIDDSGNAHYVLPSNEPSPGAQSPLTPTPEGVVGPLYTRDGALHFQSAITLGHGLGGIRVTRRVGASSANRRIAANLLGPDAALLIGNRDGVLWSGTEQLQYPGRPETPTRYQRNGTTWLSSAAAVKQTPWLYAVELPEAAALAPARALVMPLVGTGLLVAAVGIAVGLRIGRRIATPLEDLTSATEAIARGDRDVHLPAVTRQDEIGRLARAFASMATNVRAVHDRLETEVDTRTEELRKSERFAEIGRLSGTVGHELRNPLGVMTTVVVMIDGMPDASPKLKEYARLLREQLRLSERIITDVLDRARSGAPVHTVVDVTELLDDIVIRAAVPPHITVERKDVLPLPPVALDRDHVGQIVWNLITNAAQAIQGHMERPGHITVGAGIRNDRLCIEVCDTGPGLSAVEAERIFEPMYTTKAAGVGLGLSISRAFARASGGDLFVSPSSGPGACFVLDLPAHADQLRRD